MFEKIKNYFKYIKDMSKKAHYESYMWGPKKSIFAKIMFDLIYIIRFISPLQFFKQTYRYSLRENNKTEKKERADFHAYHTEIYLIAVLTFTTIIYFLERTHFYQEPSYAIITVLVILLIESIFWMLYYMFFRALMEKHLSIFNEAEYLVCLPVAIITQTLIITILLNFSLNSPYHGLSPFETLSLILPIKINLTIKIDDTITILLSTLGYIYTAIIIGNVVSLIPPLPIQKRQNISIIGAGDVVKNRILDALLELYKPNQISIISFNISDDFQKELKKRKIYFEIKKNRADIIKIVKQRSSFAIIATPTQYHYSYMIDLSNSNIPFAVEKPITNFKPYLLELKNNEKIMEHGFLLSYYWLEKAITLNYFLTLNPIYKKYIIIKEPEILENDFNNDNIGFLQITKHKLGKLNNINITLLEEDEIPEREWSLKKENGGMLFETLIHPLTILYHLVDKRLDFKIQQISWYKSDNINTTGVNLKGNIDDCNFEINTNKFVQKQRFVKLAYENGDLYLNFDSRECEIQVKNEDKIILAINNKFETKYEVQLHLVDEFIQNDFNWRNIRFDDYPNQIELLLYVYDNIYTKYLDETIK